MINRLICWLFGHRHRRGNETARSLMKTLCGIPHRREFEKIGPCTRCRKE